jgi:hypothetical protein
MGGPKPNNSMHLSKAAMLLNANYCDCDTNLFLFYFILLLEFVLCFKNILKKINCFCILN